MHKKTPTEIREAHLQIWEAKKQERRRAGLCIVCGTRGPQHVVHDEKYCDWCYTKIKELMGG